MKLDNVSVAKNLGRIFHVVKTLTALHCGNKIPTYSDKHASVFLPGTTAPKE